MSNKIDYNKKYENYQKIHKLSVEDGNTCQENELTDHEKMAEIDLDDAADIESAYEDSFDSDESDDELEAKSVQQFSASEIPLYRFSNSRIPTKKQNVIASSDTVSLAPKDSKDSCLTLEEKMNNLNLGGVRRIRSAVMPPHRKNMSFTNNEVMKIERDNELLLRKIMSQQKVKRGKVPATPQKLSSSAINRKKSQKKIEEDNMV